MVAKIKEEYENKKFIIKKETNIDISKLLETSKLVADIVNEKLERTRPVVGENVNIHSSGIHQDGILKNKGIL